jgi:hypothetical protein
MKRVIPIIGIVTVVLQLIRFWPLSPNTVLSAFVTGGVAYISCKLGWKVQRNQLLRVGYKKWGKWLTNAFIRTVVFLTILLALLFVSFHNPICNEATVGSMYGRCEQYSGHSAEAEGDIPFKPVGKAFYPLLLALTYYIGGAARRLEYTRDKGQGETAE